ncbi:MAG: flavodoxin family protein [Lachnospiraceae bacterium]|nr:flavodoxin family protein [Lachnospiraceae bacterium]
MKYCVLMGSPRKKGNTISIVEPFIDALIANGNDVELIWLYDKDIQPCEACRVCQIDWSIFGCQHQDDAQGIFDSILSSDVIVFATPIYSWYCTPPMKALLDRLVYGMNKFYGEEKGPSLWAGKHTAIIATCGYQLEKGADLFEEGIRRYSKHSGLIYEGMLAERDLGYKTEFIDDLKIQHAKDFANSLIQRFS